ncbi:MAG: hypothetical protein DHS20C21_17200 [Gemmatimonadota bacterium]|nr:MAG: hypothetical protein DHS20C21_17200 [Gemmatimonadota bacterium]
MKALLLRMALGHPKIVIAVAALLTLGFAALIPRVQVDTDPENMLPAEELARVSHNEVKGAFGLHDYLVVGIVREGEHGVFRPETLARVNELTDAILDLDGVIEGDVVAPSAVDDVFTEDAVLRVDTLMESAPETVADSRRVLERIRANPFLRGRLASDDGQALALFIPLESKEVAHEVGGEIQAIIDGLGGDEDYHLAGIPLAEDRFGNQMFLQMAIGGPAAFLVIFLLMWAFFRNVRLVIAPMLLAMMSVIWTMGGLIGLGFTVHIMSSMIPVFLIPIAVLDSIHVLSEFHERYPRLRNREQAMRETIDELFTPMSYTSITTIVGFASLMLTPIPPVQVFGAAVSFGVATAWLLSMTFLVAYAQLIPEKTLESFGHREESGGMVGALAGGMRKVALGRPRLVLVAGVLFFAVSVVGLTRIQVNDNPVNWFRSDHPVRVADRVMNEHLAGTYLAYVSLQTDDPDAFKSPELLGWVDGFQRHLEQDENVGSTTSIGDVVKKVRWELMGDPAEAILPDTADEIAQEIFLYEISGGDPEDLFKLISPDAARANVWIQMRHGENQDVARVVAHADEYLQTAPPGVHVTWAGLPYINIVWQAKMVSGMGKALSGSFVVVFLMMAWLFRSVRLGLLSMVPLTATIVLVYGAIGWMGKAYDMPIAVLSSLALGLSVDFSIHFLQRTREAFDETGSIQHALDDVFGAPGRAILRNVFVIAIGFVPMFFANLVPYVTVAVFFFLIMLISGFTTMISLPSILKITGGGFLKSGGKAMRPAKSAAAVAIGGLLLAGLASPTVAQDTPDANALMKASHLAMYYAGDDGSATVTMELTGKSGKTRTRSFVMLRRDEEDGGPQKYFTFFFEPSDVRRTTFMVWKDPVEDDSRWIYVPAVDLVKRISSKDKGSSFVGSDFSYEDVSGRTWTEDAHEYLGTDTINDRSAHKIQSTPLEKDSFARKITWVDQETSLPLKEEYYDHKDRLERVFLAEKIETIDGFATVTLRSMENVRKQHRTTVTFSEVRFDEGIEDDLFTERHLKSPPPEIAGRGQ